MKLTALQSLKALFSWTGQTNVTDQEMATRDYSPSELACLRQGIKANNAAASQLAAERGYKRNSRAAQLR